MGGRIWVESEAGKGSTFHFTARFGWPSRMRAREAAHEPAICAASRVLIVDDNATNRRILAEICRNWGMRPTAVDSGPARLDGAAAGRRRRASLRRLAAARPHDARHGRLRARRELRRGCRSWRVDDHDAHLGRPPDRRGPLPASWASPPI